MNKIDESGEDEHIFRPPPAVVLRSILYKLITILSYKHHANYIYMYMEQTPLHIVVVPMKCSGVFDKMMLMTCVSG